MLARVLELLPCLKQWHNAPMLDDDTCFEPDEALPENELRGLSITREHLIARRLSDTATRRPAR